VQQNIIIIDERMMLYNNFNDQTQIIINCHEWLKKDGYLVVPIYKIDSLGVACRFYSTNYIDDIGKLHGYTYLNGFTHDCWYEINKDSDKNNLDYSRSDSCINLLITGGCGFIGSNFINYYFPKNKNVINKLININIRKSWSNDSCLDFMLYPL
jgi:hypothetical protein